MGFCYGNIFEEGDSVLFFLIHSTERFACDQLAVSAVTYILAIGNYYVSAQQNGLNLSDLFHSFKWTIVYAVQRIRVGEHTLYGRIKDYQVGIITNGDAAFAVIQAVILGRSGSKDVHQFLARDLPFSTP